MAMRYGYFDSEITGVDENGMPIFDRAETSDLFRMLFANLVSSGVLASPGDCFQVLADTGMTVRVRPGFAMIKGAFAYDADEATLTIPASNASLPRLDRVVLRCNYLDRLCELVVKTGTPATVPSAPELLQPTTGDYYELGLATVRVDAGTGSITQSAIRDTRADSSVCGFITQLIDHIDTSEFMQQLTAWQEEYSAGQQAAFESWFEQIRDQLSEDAAGNLQLQIDNLAQSAETNSANIGQLTEDLDDLKTNTIGSTAMGTTATTIKGAIRELKDKLGSVAMGTAATTVTGAIKELLTKINTLTTDLGTTNSNLSTTNSNVTAVRNRVTALETKTEGLVRIRHWNIDAGATQYLQLHAISIYIFVVNSASIDNAMRGLYLVGVAGSNALGIKAVSTAGSVTVSDAGSGLIKFVNNGGATMRLTMICTYGTSV